MRLIWSYIKQYKKILFGALGLAVINQVFSLLDPQIFRMIIDGYASKAGTLPHGQFIRGVLLLLLASISVALVSRVAKNFQDYFVNVIGERTSTALYARSVNHSFSLPYSVFEDQRSGELLLKMQKARLDAKNIITSAVNIIFLSLVGITFVVIYAFIVNWIIGLVYFLIIPVMGAAIFLITKKIKEVQMTIVQETANLAGSTTETLRNVELVKSLGLESQEIARLNNVNDKILLLELKKVRLVRKLSFIQGTFVNTMRSSILLLMLWLIFKADISLGQFFSLYIYSFFIFAPLAELGTVASQYQEARASSGELEKILSIKPEERPKSPKSLGKIQSIEFSSVSFTYQSGERPSISNASFKIQGGETVAFVGLSGSGKTTIIKLLVGLYRPTKGKIFLNSFDAGEVNYDHLKKKIGLVSQETQLFAGTIRENLLFVNPKATDEDCLMVLNQASMAGLLQRGDSGLDTKIGEGGIKVSGGERQRLAIARALLRNPEILIFDEATSSLDSITEGAITRTIKDIVSARPNLITILVAHRLSTILHADRIYVLERGKIVEIGTHTELLQKGGLYRALAREQGLDAEKVL